MPSLANKTLHTDFSRRSSNTNRTRWSSHAFFARFAGSPWFAGITRPTRHARLTSRSSFTRWSTWSDHTGCTNRTSCSFFTLKLKFLSNEIDGMQTKYILLVDHVHLQFLASPLFHSNPADPAFRQCHADLRYLEVPFHLEVLVLLVDRYHPLNQ